MPRVRLGRYLLIPISERTRGHGSHSAPGLWRDKLSAFLAGLPASPR